MADKFLGIYNKLLQIIESIQVIVKLHVKDLD